VSFVLGGKDADPKPTRDYRIGEGGLLRRFEVAAHLTDLRRQVLALLAITWLPIVVLGLWRSHPQALVHDPAVHVRLLIAAPVFLILDQLFPAVCRYTLMILHDQGFVPAAAELRVDGLLRGAARLADSSIPEALLVLLGVCLGVAALLGVLPVSGLTYRTGLTADQVWYAVTDLPVFQFLLWRSVWRWAIWVRILVGLSRVKLLLVPTHPDRSGGIRFLKLPSVGYCAMLLFAISSVLCAEWGGRLTLGATLASFQPLLLVFASVATLIAFGPLLLFAPQLFYARRRGMLELGGAAVGSGRAFRKALREPASHPERPSAYELASLEQTYRETVKQLSLILFGRQDLALLLLATLLPMVPVMLLHVPLEDWRDMVALITGWAR
jgi:hypothetical protein